MSKRKAFTTDDAAALVGGGILDRIGQGRPVAPEPTTPLPPDEPQAPAEAPDERLIKMSLYLYPHQIDALDDIVKKRRKETGKTPRRNALIQEAIDAWLKTQQ